MVCLGVIGTGSSDWDYCSLVSKGFRKYKEKGHHYVDCIDVVWNHVKDTVVYGSSGLFCCV